jgi:hypothetical protein
MNTILTKTVPALNFKEVSIHIPSWQNLFITFVEDEQPIKYDVYTMPVIPAEIQDELNKRCYVHLILGSDNDQHFLVPSKIMK